MKFWDYIVGFYLFRWLFGSNSHNDTRCHDSGCDESGSPGTNPHDDIYYHDNSTDNYGDFLDDPDDYLDDPDDYLDDPNDSLDDDF